MERIYSAVTEPVEACKKRRPRREKKPRTAGLRDAAEVKRTATTVKERLTPDALRRFNADCDNREKGNQEPDWPEHKSMIEESKISGLNVP